MIFTVITIQSYVFSAIEVGRKEITILKIFIRHVVPILQYVFTFSLTVIKVETQLLMLIPKL